MPSQTKGRYTYEYPHPAVTVDVVVFCVPDGVLQVLLIRRRHEPFAQSWALPGGFVDINESLDAAAQRELQEETHLTGPYLEQLYSFGRPDRDPRGRTITVAYYALLPADERSRAVAGDDAAEAQWFCVDNLPALAFDHDEIIKCAVARLQAKARYSTVALSLMPSEFTISELQQACEAIWRKPLDRRNFRKWIFGWQVLVDTGKVRRDGAHRPARLYRYNDLNNRRLPITVVRARK